MKIYELAYKLYQIDWERRISPEMKMDTLKNYYQEVSEEDKKGYSFEDYLFDTGYFGDLYVCEEEFFNVEYLIEDYIKELLDNDELFAEYQKDLEENFYTE